jgi:hypothetical protein
MEQQYSKKSLKYREIWGGYFLEGPGEASGKIKLNKTAIPNASR